MRKILLISFIGLVLAGCGEKKLTKEFLSGDWKCIEKDFKVHNSNPDSDFGDPISVYDSRMMFKIIDDQLYRITGDEDKQLVDLNETEINESKASGDYTVTKKSTIKATDDDIFKIDIISEIKEMNSTKNTIDLRTKSESICTRIK